jgi:protein-tyrosine phosphatase
MPVNLKSIKGIKIITRNCQSLTFKVKGYLCAMKILLVCLGNICRSPLAEGILQQKAGTNGLHNGEAPHHLSQKVARKHGIDISTQLSRQFLASDFDKFDRIYAMANDVMIDMKRIAGRQFDSKKAFLFLDELYPGAAMDVKDPWYGDEDGYDEVFEQLNLASDALIKNYVAKQTPSNQHA